MEADVGSDGVVFVPPVLNDDLGLYQGLEDFSIE
jgi:hypothetical protein